MERRKVEDSLAQQVPVEGFEMADIKDDAMSFRYRPLVEECGLDNVKELIGNLTGAMQTIKQHAALNMVFRREHWTS